jgi:hypothetical protein
LEQILDRGTEFLRWWNEVFDKPDAYVALFTALLVISTIALWMATRGLFRITRDSTILARQEFIATHRPKIRIHVAEFKHIPDNYPDESENKAAASLLCFNIGESVAKKVQVRGQFFSGSNFSVDVQRPPSKSSTPSKAERNFASKPYLIGPQLTLPQRRAKELNFIWWAQFLIGTKMT